MLKCGTCVIEFYPRRQDENMISNGIESNEMFAPGTNRFFLFLGPSGENIEFCKIS